MNQIPGHNAGTEVLSEVDCHTMTKGHPPHWQVLQAAERTEAVESGIAEFPPSVHNSTEWKRSAQSVCRSQSCADSVRRG